MSEPAVILRPGRRGEGVLCSDLERRASVLFADSPYPWLSGTAAEPSVYEASAARGDLVLAVREGVPVGFVTGRTIAPDAFYVAELGVVPEAAGQRVGARLLEAAATLAAGRRHAWLVLRTFATVPWNAPYYRRLGFMEAPAELGAEARREMARIVADETDHGLPAHERLFLARPARPA